MLAGDACPIMDDQTVRYDPIGVIHTPFDSLEGMPLQPPGANETRGTLELDARFESGLGDLAGFSHCVLLYQFHAGTADQQSAALEVEPYLDTRSRGVFATRAPRRPNPIGMSIVRLEAVEDASVTVRGIDVLDGTPLIDIKPFVPAFDVLDFEVPDHVTSGWLEAVAPGVRSERADDRFV